MPVPLRRALPHTQKLRLLAQLPVCSLQRRGDARPVNISLVCWCRCSCGVYSSHRGRGSYCGLLACCQ